jgi:hypothetical protein
MVMNSSINFKIIKGIAPFVLGIIILFGCKKDSNTSYEVYKAVDSLAATFTVTPVQGDSTRFAVTNTTKGSCVGTLWNSDQGNGYVGGRVIDTIFYPLAGTYNITMQAVDKRGHLYTARPITVTTMKNDPRYIIKGGQMRAGDDQYWSHFDQGTPYGIWTLAPGAYTVTGNPKNCGIYQAVQLTGGKTYNVSITYSASVYNSTWAEVWIGKYQPVNGSDYSATAPAAGNASTQTPTFVSWSSSTTAASSGVKTGTFTPGTTGTYYFVIKVGTGSSFNSVTINNVSMYSN